MFDADIPFPSDHGMLPKHNVMQTEALVHRVNMPAPSAFAKGFKINKGSTIGEWKVEKLTIGHNTLQKWRKYSFPMVIRLKSTGKCTGKKASNELMKSTDQERIINSAFGNPYLCTIGKWKLGDCKQNDDGETVATLKSTGLAVRTFKEKE